MRALGRRRVLRPEQRDQAFDDLFKSFVRLHAHWKIIYASTINAQSIRGERGENGILEFIPSASNHDSETTSWRNGTCCPRRTRAEQCES